MMGTRGARAGGQPVAVVRSTFVTVAVVRSAFVAVAIAGMTLTAERLAGQDLPHPKEMRLPEPGFERPEPSSMRLELANGLTAYVAEDHRAPLVTVSAFVAGGYAHGEPGDAFAVAEALRRGPSSMRAPAFRTALRGMAASYRVELRAEETEVSLDVAAEDAWRALDLLARVLMEPSFEPSESVRPDRAGQAGGIDYATSLEGAITLFENVLFEGHPFGRRASAVEPRPEGAGGGQPYHTTYFVPSNVTLAVAGDFDAEEARRRTAGAFGEWAPGVRPAATTFGGVTTAPPRDVVLAQADKLQGWVVIGHELGRVPEADEAALAVMDYILGAFHLDSRLFRESRELRGLTNDNSSFLEPGVAGPGTYTFRTYGRPEAVRLLVDVTFRELDRIRETLPTEDELFVAKGALVDGLHATRYATGLDAARSYALEWLREGGHDRSAGYPDRIRDVTLEDVREAARKYIHPDRMIVSVVGPLEEIDRAPMIESEPRLDAWGRVRRAGGGSP